MKPTGGLREGCAVSAVAKVQARGQFTIPEGVRKATGAAPGASLLVRAVGPDRFEVIVLPQITADEFFQAMELRRDATKEDLRQAVTEGIERRLRPDEGSARSEVAAGLAEGAGQH